MFAPRFSLPVALLLALALVPTVIHQYVGLSVDDGRDANAVSVALAGLSGSPTGRKPSWALRKFESSDWVERWYTATGERIQLLVARSFDLKRLYHHPELAIVQSDLVARGVVRLGADVPVHVFESRGSDRRGIALYALHYDDEFVDDAIRFQIRSATSLLVGGRREMTLFFVHDEEVPQDQSIETLPATRVLLEAVDSFMRQPVKSAYVGCQQREAC